MVMVMLMVTVMLAMMMMCDGDDSYDGDGDGDDDDDDDDGGGDDDEDDDADLFLTTIKETNQSMYAHPANNSGCKNWRKPQVLARNSRGKHDDSGGEQMGGTYKQLKSSGGNSGCF